MQILAHPLNGPPVRPNIHTDPLKYQSELWSLPTLQMVGGNQASHRLLTSTIQFQHFVQHASLLPDFSESERLAPEKPEPFPGPIKSTSRARA